MADDDWFGGGDDDAPPAALKPLGKKAAEEAAAAEAAAAAAAAEAAAAEAEASAQEEAAGEQLPEAEDEYLDPDKLLLFKHWIRPKFLQYQCIYDYRKNYYDDVMEVIESRRRGVKRNIPSAQTWAERICRLRSDPLWKLERFDNHLNDIKLITRSQISGNFYNYFVKDTFNKRYSKLLY